MIKKSSAGIRNDLNVLHARELGADGLRHQNAVARCAVKSQLERIGRGWKTCRDRGIVERAHRRICRKTAGGENDPVGRNQLCLALGENAFGHGTGLRDARASQCVDAGDPIVARGKSHGPRREQKVDAERTRTVHENLDVVVACLRIARGDAVDRQSSDGAKEPPVPPYAHGAEPAHHVLAFLDKRSDQFGPGLCSAHAGHLLDHPPEVALRVGRLWVSQGNGDGSGGQDGVPAHHGELLEYRDPSGAGLAGGDCGGKPGRPRADDDDVVAFLRRIRKAVRQTGSGQDGGRDRALKDCPSLHLKPCCCRPV